jgi:DNA-binding NarL/FixJ family response regulator
VLLLHDKSTKQTLIEMPQKTITCVIVDDKNANIEGLVCYVEQIPYLTLTATFEKPTDALAFLLKNPTDLLITDINMPKLSGIDLYECLRKEVNTQVIFISGSEERILESLQYSAIDYLRKPVSLERFESSTDKALHLINFTERSFEKIPVEILREARKNYHLLSITEQRVIEHIAHEESTQKIADVLFVAKKTIETHRLNIRKKLRLLPENSLTEVAKFLIESKI